MYIFHILLKNPVDQKVISPHIVTMGTTKHESRQYRYSPLTRYTRNLLKKVNRGIDTFQLIEEGDRVLVAVSGGKDSLALLHLLLEHIRFYPANYNIGVVHVVSDFAPNVPEVREYLTGLFEKLEVQAEFLNIEVTCDENGDYKEPTCFWCAWKRRQALFRYAVDNGYNKLALGHHSDDVAETTMLNLAYHGTLETMLPKRSFFDGKFDLIRPLFYVRERELVRFADMAGLETVTCNCGHAPDAKRQVMKRIVRELSQEARQLHANLWDAAYEWWQAFGDQPLHKKPRSRN